MCKWYILPQTHKQHFNQAYNINRTHVQLLHSLQTTPQTHNQHLNQACNIIHSLQTAPPAHKQHFNEAQKPPKNMCKYYILCREPHRQTSSISIKHIKPTQKHVHMLHSPTETQAACQLSVLKPSPKNTCKQKILCRQSQTHKQHFN